LPDDHALDFIPFEHASQYFSIMVTLSPTSKQASTVARLAHVAQYFSFFCLGLCTKGFSEIRDSVIHFKLPINAITKNLALLPVITY
jgi:hypothetical protein